MKTVKFDLVLKVHNDLKEDELKSSLTSYLINDEVMHSVVTKVIGEYDAPENFFIHSMELKEKRKAKKNPVQSSKKNGIREKEWDVV
ncbi:MAG TPA: hypothetical protein DCS66_05930 [Flavobacteriaceae bacterium]|nr:hypothetical protein [Flavobacteriaceae bacterium]